MNGHSLASGSGTGLEHYRFVHKALPEINLDDVESSTKLLGKDLRAPLVISPMVGGIEEAARINRNLARAAQALGLAMGVGSQRCAIDDPGTACTYQVRDVAPDVLLLANLGAVQLNYGYGLKECRRAVEMIEADALVLHVNPLQEALQGGGNTGFAGILDRIGEVCSGLSVPVIVKEVGSGISEEVAIQLARIGVAAIDVAGVGGTSWSEVERLRSNRNGLHDIADPFSDWGIPTADSLLMVRRAAPGTTVIASGGIYHGVDVAKCIALGANAAAMAAPLLKPALQSVEEVVSLLEEVIQQLRIAMFCVGAVGIPQLRSSSALVRATDGALAKPEREAGR